MITALVGGQFGSEGKGLVLSKIGKAYSVHVRVGAANAGHTLYTGDDEKHVLQQLPCGAYSNPAATLCIGPGALLSTGILLREIRLNREWRRAHGYEDARILVDPRAHVIRQSQIQRENESDLAQRIGSTSALASEGIGVAQADRVMRSAGCLQAGDWTWDPGDGVELADVPAYLYEQREGMVLLEGTQGAGLSLTTGFFPFTTSRNTSAAGLAAECGVAGVDRTIMVVRSYPIRVAGRSGPFYYDSEEISWSDIGADPFTEKTTVTKKVRRVATFSVAQVAEGVILNDPDEIALTFCDYIDPSIAGADSETSGEWESLAAFPEVMALVNAIEHATQVRVTRLGTGPSSVVRLRRD